MKHRICIMKLPISSKYVFRDYNFAKENNFSTLDYVVVYYDNALSLEAGNIYEYLEKVFYIFNQEHPDSYRSSSLSTSDIVLIDNKEWWYCDSFGWKLLREEEIG